MVLSSGYLGVYSGSPKVGNPTASILESKVSGVLALFVLNPVSIFLGGYYIAG